MCIRWSHDGNMHKIYATIPQGPGFEPHPVPSRQTTAYKVTQSCYQGSGLGDPEIRRGMPASLGADGTITKTVLRQWLLDLYHQHLSNRNVGAFPNKALQL